MVPFPKDKARREGWKKRRRKMTHTHKKDECESQFVHYMLCCNTGICAPADLVLSHSESLRAAGLTQRPSCLQPTTSPFPFPFEFLYGFTSMCGTVEQKHTKRMWSSTSTFVFRTHRSVRGLQDTCDLQHHSSVERDLCKYQLRADSLSRNKRNPAHLTCQTDRWRGR